MSAKPYTVKWEGSQPQHKTRIDAFADLWFARFIDATCLASCAADPGYIRSENLRASDFAGVNEEIRGRVACMLQERFLDNLKEVTNSVIGAASISNPTRRGDYEMRIVGGVNDEVEAYCHVGFSFFGGILPTFTIGTVSGNGSDLADFDAAKETNSLTQAALIFATRLFASIAAKQLEDV